MVHGAVLLRCSRRQQLLCHCEAVQQRAAAAAGELRQRLSLAARSRCDSLRSQLFRQVHCRSLVFLQCGRRAARCPCFGHRCSPLRPAIDAVMPTETLE